MDILEQTIKEVSDNWLEGVPFELQAMIGDDDCGNCKG
jgi:hypothetical protein